MDHSFWRYGVNSLLRIGKQKRLLLCGLFFLLWLPFLFFRSVLNPSLICLFGSVAILGSLVVFALLVTLSRSLRESQTVAVAPAPSPTPEKITTFLEPGTSLPVLSIPRTAAAAHRTMTPSEFELFSAAVIIAVEKDRGLTFVAHSGKARDRGVDVRLRNFWGGNVIVQSKRYANSVGGEALLHFRGSIGLHDAVYGFFVTTSVFTKEAQLVMNDPSSRIFGIDGRKLDRYLQYHHREIAQIYYDIQQRVTSKEK
jgi:hypothetical protein